MNRKRPLLFGLICWLGLVGSAAASADTSVRAQLQAFAGQAAALRCQFTQQVVDARGEARPLVHGTLALAAPDRFRWHTSAPEEQLIVADGQRVWVYDPLLEQVTVRAQTAAQAQSPLALLTDPSRLEQEYTVSEPTPHDGLRWLRLQPKRADSSFEHVDIGVRDGAPVEMVFANAMGGESRLRFSHWQRNPELPADTFAFTPPAGVDVVGDTPAAAASTGG